MTGEWSTGTSTDFACIGACDKNFKGKVRGNRLVEIFYVIEKNKIKKIVSDSVYCPAFDTTRYEVNY